MSRESVDRCHGKSQTRYRDGDGGFTGAALHRCTEKQIAIKQSTTEEVIASSEGDQKDKVTKPVCKEGMEIDGCSGHFYFILDKSAV